MPRGVDSTGGFSLPCHKRPSCLVSGSGDEHLRQEGDGHAGVRGWRDRGSGAEAGSAARGTGPRGDRDDEAKLEPVQQLGATGVVMDGLDAASVGEAVAKARPEVIAHQMTAISMAHAGKPDIKHPDRWFALANRLRREGTDHLLGAAEATGVTHVVAQGYASWNGIREGG